MDRYAEVTRKTGETDIVVKLDLDGSGVCDISTGVPFFDHMLNAFGRHGLFDLTVHAVGDVEVDAHHTVEDVGIVLGEAFADYAACELLEKKYGKTFVMNFLEKHGVKTGFSDYPHSAKKLLKIRSEINRLIALKR